LTPPSDQSRRILFVSLKKEAEPLLSQLRAAGHQVSVIQELDQAQVVLAGGGFDGVVLPSVTIEPLLAQRVKWERSGGDSWRRSTVSIAHDLRNLLSALARCTRELREAEGAPRSPGADLTQLQRTIATLSAFLEELTDEFDGGSRRDLLIQVVDLEDAIETAAVAVYALARERRQRLVIDVEDGCRYVRADSTRIKRVLSNLLLHASRQTPSLGTVKIAVHREADDCVMSVSYNAETAGIAGLTELFGGGSGQALSGGLSGVQEIVEQHGGRLWLESERGARTTIFVSFPSPELIPNESKVSPVPG
jgi:signal transduction histidine kinase